jgi:hypothetical protein
MSPHCVVANGDTFIVATIIPALSPLWNVDKSHQIFADERDKNREQEWVAATVMCKCNHVAKSC